jgi:Alpha/beta hydrolase of unknown function (DUF900)
MSKAVLIHGNAIGIDFPIRANQLANGSFESFQKYLDSCNAKLFIWSKFTGKYGIESLAPDFLLHQYRTEQKYVFSQEAFNSLNNFVRTENPTILVGHSMGCQYILNWLEQVKKAPSVQKIYLLQGDFDSNFEFSNPMIVDLIESDKLQIVNYFCRLDNTLMASCQINGNIRSGLIGSISKYIKNIHWLKPGTNIHHCTIRDIELARVIMG